MSLFDAIESHWLDHAAALASGRRRLFNQGWGDEALLSRIATPERLAQAPRSVDVRWGIAHHTRGLEIRDGTFVSPTPELPEALQRVHVRWLLPRSARSPALQPVYVVLPWSGGEGFETRTRLLRPLVEKAGLSLLLLENAYYGLRRPAGQIGANLRTVCDQILMNVSMIEEARALLDWLSAQGYARLGVTGYSMGGSIAALVAAVSTRPLAAAILAAGNSAVPIFTEGFLSRSIDFEALTAGSGGTSAARERLGEIIRVADLDRYPAPLRPDAAIVVGAKRDGYVYARQPRDLHARWKGSELRWIDSGHAGALFLSTAELRRAIEDAMARL